MENNNKSATTSRKVMLHIFLAPFALSLIVLLTKHGTEFIKNPDEVFMVFWCISGTCLGFCSIIVRFISSEGSFGSVCKEYLTEYVPNILWISLLVFSILKLKSVSGALFYTMSLSLCLFCGFYLLIIVSTLYKMNELISSYLANKFKKIPEAKDESN